MAHVVAAGNLPDWLAPVAVLERFSEGGTGPFVVINGPVVVVLPGDPWVRSDEMKECLEFNR